MVLRFFAKLDNFFHKQLMAPRDRQCRLPCDRQMGPHPADSDRRRAGWL